MTTLQNIAALWWVLLAQVAVQATLLPLFEFAGPEAAQQWQAVNDGVMGGVSDGRFHITEEGMLEFSGTLSLENNGGFCAADQGFPSGLIRCGVRKSPHTSPTEVPMNGPAKNRLHDYEAGWLTMLISISVATEAEARAAMCRVAQKAIDDMEERRERRRREGKRRQKPGAE